MRIQGFFERKGADSKRTPASNNEYALLSGLLFCRACGSLMYAKRRSNNPQRFDYICSGKLRLGRCDCPNLNGPQIDDRVCRELMTLSIQPSQIAQRLGTLKKGLHVGRDPGEALGQKIRSCEQEMSRLLDLLAGSALDPAVIKRVNTRVSELDQEVQQMIQARDRLGAAPDLTETRALQLDALARTLTEFGALFLCATIYEKRTLVRLLIERCEWDGREFTLFRYEL